MKNWYMTCSDKQGCYPAFLYERILGEGADGECPLWSGPNLNQFQDKVSDENLLKVSHSDPNQHRKDGPSKYKITYDNAKFLVSILSEALYELYLSPLMNNQGNVVCAVCINEGPYLALAVLSLHILCLSFHNIIIVPIDLSEGNDRVKYQFQDVGCKIVLMRKNMSDLSKLSNEVLPDNIDLIDMDCLIGKGLSLVSDQKLSSTKYAYPIRVESPSLQNFISHVVYTSGSTGRPKGCICSMNSLQNYIIAKNMSHGITDSSVVLLASALSFDPCISDIIATFYAKGSIVLPRRSLLQSDIQYIITKFDVTHVLCTPSLWRLMPMNGSVPPSLRVIALGGEKIPRRTISYWSRNDINDCGPRLFSTYGVTEACVYQTFGEIFKSDVTHTEIGQCVGLPLHGNNFMIDYLKDEGDDGAQNLRQGEVLLFGNQVDYISGYINDRCLTKAKFSSKSCNHKETDSYCYRTGDLGYTDSSGRLFIIGRIHGEEGMVKINGVRVELGEIETALLVDGENNPDNLVLLDCVMSLEKEETNDDLVSKMVAYCVLSRKCREEIIEFSQHGKAKSYAEKITKLLEMDFIGYLCPNGPLLTLLRYRCENKVRMGCTPSTFVLIDKIPTSPTGKTDKRKLPPVRSCISLTSSKDETISEPLSSYGLSGNAVHQALIKHLNLQPNQHCFITDSANFSMLGGDSLISIRITRSLYAMHHGIQESRHLGGVTGTLDGPFQASHLLSANTLGDYVTFLDRHGVCQDLTKDLDLNPTPNQKSNETINLISESSHDKISRALIDATILGQTNVAISLLKEGADPNFGSHKGRLGKVSNRLQRRAEFSSTPIHVACAQGNNVLVENLIKYGSKCNIPDASAIYPIHLACAGSVNSQRKDEGQEDQSRRLQCVISLLNQGNVPLTMKDGNKQTILHCAARSGNIPLIEYIFERSQFTNPKFYNWTDHWFRTPVHWAILNRHFKALKVLVEKGCSMNPSLPSPGKKNKRTSSLIESPLQLAERLYQDEGDDLSRNILQFCLARRSTSYLNAEICTSDMVVSKIKS